MFQVTYNDTRALDRLMFTETVDFKEESCDLVFKWNFSIWQRRLVGTRKLDYEAGRDEMMTHFFKTNIVPNFHLSVIRNEISARNF